MSDHYAIYLCWHEGLCCIVTGLKVERSHVFFPPLLHVVLTKRQRLTVVMLHHIM